MSRLLFNHSGIAADAFGHLLALSRLLTGDVIEGLQVQAKASPNMSVTIGQGTAGITIGTYPDNFRYWIANDTTTGSPAGESVTITTASASNPRIDTIVAYVNEGATFTTSPANMPGGWTAAAVAGTPAASPTAPSSAAIQSAIGAGNPYIVLATVLVGTSVTQITNANITDLRTFAQAANQNIATNRLGFASRTTDFTTASSSLVDITSLSVTVSVPSGGRSVKVSFGAVYALTTGSAGTGVDLSIVDVTAGVEIGHLTISQPTTSYAWNPCFVAPPYIPAAGSRTYKVQASTATGTLTLHAIPTSPAFILVEAT